MCLRGHYCGAGFGVFWCSMREGNGNLKRLKGELRTLVYSYPTKVRIFTIYL